MGSVLTNSTSIHRRAIAVPAVMFALTMLSICSTSAKCDDCDDTATASRGVIDKDDSPSMVGTWEWVLQMGPVKKEVSMEVTKVDGALRGIITAPDGAKLKVDRIECEKQSVAFEVQNDAGPFSMKLSFDGQFKGSDQLVGSVRVEGGPIKQKQKWNALRKR